MRTTLITIPAARIAEVIPVIRDEKVILDTDLALLYGVETRALIQAVKRNSRRFPLDFMFQLTRKEFDALRSQFVISKGRGGRRHLPYAFTEHGVIMAANEKTLEPPGLCQISFILSADFTTTHTFHGSHRRTEDAMRSVPPRGSGWVCSPEEPLGKTQYIESVVASASQPTRYREVVLTSLL